MDELVDYEDRLRAVFDVCDDRKEGFISVDHFVNLAKEHFGADGGEVRESSASPCWNPLGTFIVSLSMVIHWHRTLSRLPQTSLLLSQTTLVSGIYPCYP